MKPYDPEADAFWGYDLSFYGLDLCRQIIGSLTKGEGKKPENGRCPGRKKEVRLGGSALDLFRIERVSGGACLQIPVAWGRTLLRIAYRQSAQLWPFPGDLGRIVPHQLHLSVQGIRTVPVSLGFWRLGLRQ